MSLKTIIVIIYFLASIIAFTYSIVGNRKPTKVQNVLSYMVRRYLLNAIGYVLLATAVYRAITPVTSIVFVPLFFYCLPGLPTVSSIVTVIKNENLTMPNEIIVNRFIWAVTCIALICLIVSAVCAVLF